VIIERRNDMRRPWRQTGALVRDTSGPARWIPDWVDSQSKKSDPQLLWEYLVEKGGGNGFNQDAAFLRVRSLRDAARLARHLRAQAVAQANRSIVPDRHERGV
jgi:hypothetical protein